MTKILVGVLAGLVVGAVVTWTIVKHDEAGDEAARNEATQARHDDGRAFVKLDSEGQRHAGLETAPLEAAALKPEVKAYGRVVDPAPLSAQVVEFANARAALEASTKEFNRLRVLHIPDQNISSTRALEGAEAAMIRDQIALDAAQLKLVTAWGKPVATQPDLLAFVHSLASLQIALVRVDVPLGTALPSPPTGARIAAAAAPELPIEAQLLGPAVNADPQMQGQGFLLLVGGSSLRPGAAVVAWLTLAGEEEKGVIVPRSAVVRHEGGAFVYVQSSADVFERQGLDLAHPTENGWFVDQDEALRAGQRIVLVGAQQLLSEELKEHGGEEE